MIVIAASFPSNPLRQIEYNLILQLQSFHIRVKIVNAYHATHTTIQSL